MWNWERSRNRASAWFAAMALGCQFGQAAPYNPQNWVGVWTGLVTPSVLTPLANNTPGVITTLVGAGNPFVSQIEVQAPYTGLVPTQLDFIVKARRATGGNATLSIEMYDGTNYQTVLPQTPLTATFAQYTGVGIPGFLFNNTVQARVTIRQVGFFAFFMITQMDEAYWEIQ